MIIETKTGALIFTVCRAKYVYIKEWTKKFMVMKYLPVDDSETTAYQVKRRTVT